MRRLVVALLRIVALGMVAFALLVSGGTPAYAWSYPAPLNTNAGTDWGDDMWADLRTDGGGNWVAVWASGDNLGGTIGTDRDILVSRSTDNGAAWTAPTPLNSYAYSDDLRSDEYPRVATDGGGNWAAVWCSQGPGDRDIMVARSTDNGATWTTAAALTSGFGHDEYPRVATDGDGNWMAVWTSTDDLGGTIGGDWDILVARSTNNGASWTPPAALNTNAGTDSLGDNDDFPEVATDGAGNWVAVWDHWDSLGATDTDIMVARSTDNGATWTDPVALNTNAATDSGEDGHPQVTTDGQGNWVAVWNSSDDLGGTIGWDHDILVARSTNNGASWTDPTVLNSNAASDSGDDWVPEVTTDGAGNWVAVWWSQDSLGDTIGIDHDVLVARSTNNGSNWTDPTVLNSNAASDSGNDLYPEVATDGRGNWVGVWESDDSLGGTIGTDNDILYTTEVWPLAAVGGVAELPHGSGSSPPKYIALAAAAGALLALTAGAWYARRRLSR